MPERKVTCPDCGAEEGHLHELFCSLERCPYCRGQLASCECLARVLELDDGEREAVEEFIDDTEEPLRGIMGRWKAALASQGRIPFRTRP